MKKISLIIILLVAFAFILNIAEARKGVGILWSTETVIVNENEEKCIEYGLYNPWDEDITVTLETTNEINEILTNKDVDTVNLKAHTTHENSIPAKLCFDVPKVYEQDCLIGGLFCEQKCDQEPVTYSGEVIVSEQPIENNAGGSATTSSASSRLAVKVNCVPSPRNLVPLYLIIILVLIVIILLMLYQKRKVQKLNPL